MSDGTRKMTKGWEIGPTGKMVNITGGVDGIVIDDGLPVTDSAVVKTEPPPVPRPPNEPERRNQKSTLETFNDELAVLDRPLEGEVEYFDEAPPAPSRWRRAALFTGIVVVMGLGGGLVLSRQRQATAETPAQAAAQPAPPAAAAAPTVLAATAPAAAAPTPPAEPAAAPAAAPAADDSADQAAADDDPAPAKPSAWSKVRTGGKSGHAKHARSGGKTVRRHAVASKRTSRHH